MYCRHCGREIEDNAAFCPHCGGALRKEAHAGGGLYGYELTRLKVPGETKNPGVAAAIGFFFGWILLGPVGYVYLGQWNWFWLTFVVQIFAIPLTVGLAYILLPVLFAIHQYQMAKDLNVLVVEKRSKMQGDARRSEAGLSAEE
ncbi:MAG: zinc ribbon domain-containing protein [Candidatus Krumholzibacteria bacterium]|nr:zinc ribbon domain-containing protein [Candidatus Krumholzibacteria bacterium]